MAQQLKSTLMRIHIDLNEEIRKMAEKNGMKLIEASRMAAQILKNNQNKKIQIIEEIKF